MEGNTFVRLASNKFLTIVIFILIAISSITSASQNSTIPTNSTQTNIEKNNAIPSNSIRTKYYENTNIIPSNPSQTFRTYVTTSCKSTTYPSICYQSLSPYASKIGANPLKLCNISLTLALKGAHSASSTISKLLKSNNLTHYAEQVVKDCFGNVKDSIGQLQDSLHEMGHLNNVIDKEFQISNMKTWVSASITNDETCSDGFDEMNVDANVRDKIRKIVLNVARKTSNALYFINNLRY
ncbi:pectinesterase inhibitor 4-like [Gastrolobium bilobum]|uniref:pectinesterase inhibitor 4-like n=1 Tax=Gastrolobium bilobum TaxID=150636 RepID=UPI002AB0C5BD|nr:pectinesterase inhibitor 4-like [Gastrolobium bilobum]